MCVCVCVGCMMVAKPLEQIANSKEMQQLFTKYCHHVNISAILISQNIFKKHPCSISLNCHIIVLLCNKGD